MITTREIIEQFNLLNDPELTYPEFRIADLGKKPELPAFKIHFLVSSPYFTEGMNGQFQLARKYRRQFSRLTATLTQKYSEILGDPNKLKFETAALDQVDQIVKDLEEALETELVIPGKLELGDIELTGSWTVYRIAFDHAMRYEAMIQNLNQYSQDPAHKVDYPNNNRNNL